MADAKADTIFVGETCIFHGAYESEEAQFRGKIGDKAVIIIDGRQLQVLASTLEKIIVVIDGGKE